MNRNERTIQDESSNPTTTIRDDIVSLKEATQWFDLIIKNMLRVGPGPDEGYPNTPLSLTINESPRILLNLKQMFNILDYLTLNVTNQ